MAERPLIIGIAGGSGSGKSTVARNVGNALGAGSMAAIDMDGYYKNFAHLPFDERKTINWDHPDAFDWDLLLRDLRSLADRQAIKKPIYDFVTHTRRVETIGIEPVDVVVIDGILLFVDERIRELCEVKVFVDADADIRLIRRIRRDMSKRGRPLDEILDQYLTTVQPMHLQFVEPSKRYADIIVPRGNLPQGGEREFSSATTSRTSSPSLRTTSSNTATAFRRHRRDRRRSPPLARSCRLWSFSI
jgi:uridine kinase